MKFNNKKTLKFRGGIEPNQLPLQPPLPPIKIGQPPQIREQTNPPPYQMNPEPQQIQPQQESYEMNQPLEQPQEEQPEQPEQQEQQPQEEQPEQQEQQPQEEQPQEEQPQEESYEMNPQPEQPQEESYEMNTQQEPQQEESYEMNPQQEPQQEESYEMNPPPEPLEKPETIPVEPLFPPSTEEESDEIIQFRNKMNDQTNKRDYFYINTNISTELNKDKTYKREGILHFTDSINVKSNTNIGNIIGQTVIENTTYDKLRNTALKKVDILLGENRRCYNTRIEFEKNNDTIFIHIYGTLYVKKSIPLV